MIPCSGTSPEQQFHKLSRVNLGIVILEIRHFISKKLCTASVKVKRTVAKQHKKHVNHCSDQGSRNGANCMIFQA